MRSPASSMPRCSGEQYFHLPTNIPVLVLFASVAVALLGDAEVDELHVLLPVLVARDHDVLGTDVAMHDAGAMDGLESVQRLDGQLRRVLRRQRTARLDQLVKIGPLDVLPHHVARAVVERGEVVERGDVRMIDARRQPRFAHETVVRAGVVRDAGAHQLDDADRVQMDVEDLVDLAHPADAEAREDLVLAVDRMLEVIGGGNR